MKITSNANNLRLSLCPFCNCMTITKKVTLPLSVHYECGKCGKEKYNCEVE